MNRDDSRDCAKREPAELLAPRCIPMAGRLSAGFARLEIVDGHAYLEKLSVDPTTGDRVRVPSYLVPPANRRPNKAIPS